jgi:secreted trypsin-like serine protease
MKFLLICLAFGITCANSYVLESNDEARQSDSQLVRSDRIMGGQVARRNQFPYQVALILSLPGTQQTFCSGSIISNHFILTAAHCLAGTTRVDVIAGVHNINDNQDGEYRTAVLPRDTLIHMNFNPDTLENDMGIIRVNQRITYSNRIQPVALPSRQFVRNLFVGTIITVSGWGRFAASHTDLSPDLRFVTLPIISNAQCMRTYGHYIQPTNLCASGANGRSSCPGDSGGPVVSQVNGRIIQIGVVSFGAGDCGSGFPVGFARVTSFLDWIDRNTDVTIH